MKIRISYLVLALAIYMPFETVILAHLPVPDMVYSILRLGIEAAIYLIFLVLIINNMSFGKLLNKTLLDIPFLVFLAFAFFTMLVNKAPIVESLVDIRSLFKYTLLYFIVANIDFKSTTLRKFLIAFVIIAFIESLIAAAQHFLGIGQFWYPKASDLDIAGTTSNFKILETGFAGGRELGSSIGTFGDTVPLGNFMVIAIAVISSMFLGYIYVNAYRMVFLVITLGLVLFALFCTYSRGSVLVGFMGIPLAYFLGGKLYKFYPLVLGGTLLLALFLGISAITPGTNQGYYNPKFTYTDPISNFTEAFSSSYAEQTMETSRGYILGTLLPPYIKTLPLIGYGPCMDNSLTLMCNNVLGAGNFHAENVMIIADVYWFALLTCYGFIGLGIFCTLMIYLFYGAFIVFKKSEFPEYKIIGLALMIIILINIPYMLIIRTLLFRPFAFYFWFFSGLVGGEYRRIISKQKAKESEHLEGLKHSLSVNPSFQPV